MGKRILKVAVIVIVILMVLTGILYGGYYYYNKNVTALNKKHEEEIQKLSLKQWRDLCYGNKTVEDLDVTGMNASQVEYIINNRISDINNRVIRVKIDGTEYVNTVSSFSGVVTVYLNGEETEKSVEELADSMVKADKDLTKAEQEEILENPEKGTKIEITFLYKVNGEVIEEYVSKLEKTYYLPKVEATIKMQGENFVVTKSQSEKILNGDTIIETFSKDLLSGDITPIEITGECTVNEPKYKYEELSLIKTQISSFTTEFVEASSRGQNIIIGTARINGLLVLPGEQFSVDQIILPRSPENGYQIAKSYLDGELVDSYGGGVCQISTTLYNTLLRAGIIPDKRNAHSMPVAYVDLGLDAAVTTGVKDLIFTNTLKYPIYISAYNEGNSLKYSIYSVENALGGYTYQPRSVKHSELVATAYLDVYKNGVLEQSIYLHKDKYDKKHES